MNYYGKEYYYDYISHHGILGQKWGVRRFQNKDGTLTPNGKLRAKKIYKEASKKEPKITKDITTAIKNCGAESYGLEHRQKTEESIDRKLQIKDSLSDALRYTALSNNKDFTKNYFSIKKDLESKGYEEIKCKNYFQDYKDGKVKHKSVQSVFKDKQGYEFELQFQTPESQKAKDLKVPLYEERRNPNVTAKRAKELEKEMVKLAEEVPYPNGYEKIRGH